MRHKLDNETEKEEQEKELSPKEIKRRERQEGVEKRRKARQKDKVARFAGAILLGMLLLVGFLLWVGGEMKTEEVPSSAPSELIKVR